MIPQIAFVISDALAQTSGCLAIIGMVVCTRRIESCKQGSHRFDSLTAIGATIWTIFWSDFSITCKPVLLTDLEIISEHLDLGSRYILFGSFFLNPTCSWFNCLCLVETIFNECLGVFQLTKNVYNVIVLLFQVLITVNSNLQMNRNQSPHQI